MSGNSNWPSSTISLDGSIAGDFNYYYDGWSLGRSGEYVGVTNLTMLRNMTNATVSLWARYRRAYSGNYLEDGYANPISAGYAVKGSWELGRASSDYTELAIYTNDGASAFSTIVFPDRTFSTAGDSLGWHHYAFTFEKGTVRAYYDGTMFQSATWPVDYLTVAWYFLALGCKTHNGDPWLSGGLDTYPNHGWMNGTIDDVRVYRRALANSEIQTLYSSFDRVPPSVPANLQARSASSSQVELRWAASTDYFGVAGYAVSRNGIPVGNVQGSLFVDTNLAPSTTYLYQVEAYDAAGNRSGLSASHSTSTPGAGTQVEVILDDDDGLPWVTYAGTWTWDCCWIVGQWANGWKNDGNAAKGTKSVTFRPYIPQEGDYNVFIRHVQRSSFATNTPVDIEYAGGTQTVLINQRTGGGTWKSLGTYHLAAGTNAVVRIRNGGTAATVIADAVRFTR